MVEQFEGDLSTIGISIAQGSDLELICLHILDLESKRQGKSYYDIEEDIRPLWRRAVGLVSLLQLLGYARIHKKLSIFKPHLRILNQGTVPQNVRALSDDTCNKVFEMLVALLCLPIAEHVKLDDPHHSQGNNPDILATIEGTTWGFSCKTPNSTSAKSMFDRLKEGVDQIERSRAEKGIVYYNFRKVIDHDRVWPEVKHTDETESAKYFRFQVWPNSDPVNSYFRALIDTKNGEMLKEIGVRQVQSVFASKKSLPGSMIFLQSAAAFETEFGHCVSSISFPGIMIFGSITRQDMGVLERIQRSEP